MFSSLLFFCCVRLGVTKEWIQIASPVIRQMLLEGERMVKYHVSLLEPLGPEFTRGWVLAMKKTEPVETALFTASMQNRNLNSPEDIRTVFML